MIDSSTKDGVGGAVELEEALEAFAMSVGVAGLEWDGQLAAELGNIIMWWGELEVEPGQTGGSDMGYPRFRQSVWCRRPG